MQITIRKTDTESAPASLFTRRFAIKSKMVLALENGKLTYTVAEVAEPYERDIPDQDNDYGFDDTVPAVYLAEFGGKPAGRIRMISWWNGFAYVDDVVVNPEFRGQGIGRRLLEHGIQWARENNYPGVMLETQHDNVPACMLYQSCGFALGGFDANVYKALHLPNPEIALYWYLIF